MKTTHVWPQEPRLEGGEWLACAVLERADGIQKRIEFRMQEELGEYLTGRHDHFLIASLFAAMATGGACHVHGQVSRSLVVNAAEYCTIWRSWEPLRYNEVDLSADATLPGRQPDAQASWVLAFSGGVDACTTLLRNTKALIGVRSRPVNACLQIQGMDIPLDSPEAFRIAHNSAKVITSSVNVPIFTIKTNLRSMENHWESEFGSILGSCLSVLSGGFTGGLIAGDNGYAKPVLPWGSSPITNHFLGSDYFQIHTDAAELTRLQKVAFLKDWPEAMQHLRVCWEGPATGGNCGICEKCVRTQLEFLVSGMAPSSCFPHRLRKGEVVGIVAHNHAQFDLLEEMLVECDEKGITGWWVDELRTVVERGVQTPTTSAVKRLRAKLKVRTRMKSAVSSWKSGGAGFPKD